MFLSFCMTLLVLERSPSPHNAYRLVWLVGISPREIWKLLWLRIWIVSIICVRGDTQIWLRVTNRSSKWSGFKQRSFPPTFLFKGNKAQGPDYNTAADIIFTFNLFSVPMKCRCLDYFRVNKRYAQVTDLSEVTGLWKEHNADLKTGCLKSSCLCLLPWFFVSKGLM